MPTTKLTPTQPFGLEVWYGVAKKFVDDPHAVVLFLDQPVTVEGTLRDRLNVEIFNFDASLAPAGKTVVKVVLNSNYDYWKELSVSNEKYREEKGKVAELIVSKLENRFPKFINNIEATDVVTPISSMHWTGAYRGCQAWGAPKEYIQEVTQNGVSKTLPGLGNFYMV